MRLGIYGIFRSVENKKLGVMGWLYTGGETKLMVLLKYKGALRGCEKGFLKKFC
jgi:hypothetical protein